MHINYTKLNKKHWFEDSDGNEIMTKENTFDQVQDIIKREISDSDNVFYKRCFPMELRESIDEYCYHPTNGLVKWLCKKNNCFYRLVSKGKDRTFKNIMTVTHSFGGDLSQRCIVAMVNSGNFTLEQAIWVFGNSCERCTNVLLYTYLNGEDGYEEYSDEWKKSGGSCAFCWGLDK